MARKDGFARFFTIIVPVGLLVATFAGIGWHVWKKGDGSMERDRRSSRAFSAQEVQNFVDKLDRFAPERNLETDEGRKGMRTTAAMIEGTLSPENAGYAVVRGANISSEGQVFHPVAVTLEGQNESSVVRVMTRYDGGKGRSESLGTVLAVAQSLSSELPPASVRFIFLTGSDDSPLGVGAGSREKYGRTIWVGSGLDFEKAGLQTISMEKGGYAAGLALIEAINDATVRMK